jgi:hypothetical protein
MIDLSGLDATLGARSGLALTVTAVGPEAPGFLRVHACGPTQPAVSMSTYRPGESVATFTVVDAADRFCVSSKSRTRIVVDIVGVFQKGAGARFTPLTPARVFDSRDGAAMKTYEIPLGGLPDGAEGVAAHLTVTGAASPGFVTLHAGGAVPPNSSLNFRAGEALGMTALVPLDATSKICATASTAVHVIVDVEAAYGSKGTMSLIPQAPTRVFDSRPNAPATSFTLTIPGLPPGATMAALHVTAVDAAGGAFATAHLCGQAQGDGSIVNVNAAGPRTAFTLAPVDAAGKTCITSSSPLQIVADLSGAIAP